MALSIHNLIRIQLIIKTDPIAKLSENGNKRVIDYHQHREHHIHTFNAAYLRNQRIRLRGERQYQRVRAARNKLINQQIVLLGEKQLIYQQDRKSVV